MRGRSVEDQKGSFQAAGECVDVQEVTEIYPVCHSLVNSLLTLLREHGFEDHTR